MLYITMDTKKKLKPGSILAAYAKKISHFFRLSFFPFSAFSLLSQTALKYYINIYIECSYVLTFC